MQMNVDKHQSLLSETEVRSLLKQHGISLTRPRVLISRCLLSKPQHVTAKQVYSKICETGEPIARATVYNTLAMLVKEKLLREIILDGNQSYYDSNTTPHHHFYNIDTGELSDIMNSEKLAQALESMNSAEVQLPDGTALDRVELIIRIRNTSDLPSFTLPILPPSTDSTPQPKPFD